MKLEFVCRLCKEDQEPFIVGMDDLTDHSNGALAQEVFSYLNADQRELLISSTCNRCWESMTLNIMHGDNRDDGTNPL